MAEEMRTCKTCGETKPLAEGFYKNRIGDDSKVYYRHDCKRCWDKAMSERNKQRVKKTETVAEEMRTCKTCGEIKPLEGFNAIQLKGVKTYYYNSCKTCRNKEVKRKRIEKTRGRGSRRPRGRIRGDDGGKAAREHHRRTRRLPDIGHRLVDAIRITAAKA
ncbi:TPA: hypothetical protein WHR34_000344 [Neisseria meningitidis]